MLTDDYRIRLDAFEGPLDLLLHLIRKAEVEITDIPIATVADQYLRHLEGIERIDIDLAGEFLVMAATLMEIKSRMLAPAAPGDAVEGDADQDASGLPSDLDPRTELVQQLLAYKRYRDAADALSERRDEWSRRYASGRSGYDREAVMEAAAEESELEIDDAELFDLVEAFSRIIAQVNFSALGDHKITFDTDDTPIELHAEDILDRLKRESSRNADQAPSMPLREIFRGRTRGEMVGLFIALLELVRRRAVTVSQEDKDDEIAIRVRDEEPEQGESTASSAPEGAAQPGDD